MSEEACCVVCGHSVVAWCPHDSTSRDDLVCYNCGVSTKSEAWGAVKQLRAQLAEAQKVEKQEGMTIKQIHEALPVDEEAERKLGRLINAQMSTECRQFPQEGMVSVPVDAVNDVIEVLAQNNWRGDLLEILREAAQGEG